ncbi:Fasciclin-like arabinogalactan protein [Trichophyton interdigitale]|uniref:Fasciclin-like arabinogalactan protein n=1 Tax=Trichophyton interdigitale TaxID=101480 RepID=A0A9P4YK13_9EURO|nr:Fasciclin-like arabinogalactan protein [Trichophyton interdigitale]KAF3900521.1 Fasciclin-like arabinogalactan protein [Trichophyton interdigitale]KAG8210269.1 Fasciclin-like arabinogalactan protein [Trichophyton interdigitale]
MLLHYILVALWATVIYAKSFSEDISEMPELSEMSSFLNQTPEAKDVLDQQKNVTLLALENSAFRDFVGQGQGNDNQSSSDPSLLRGIFSYQLVKGLHNSEQITTTPQFSPTELNDEGFTNVSSGQVVQLVEKDGKDYAISGLNDNSTIIKPGVDVENGVIHVIDRPLTLPQSVTATLQAANLTSFQGALQRGNAVSNANDPKDITVFAPRNLGFQRIGTAFENISAEDLGRISNYHIVKGKVLYSPDLTGGDYPTYADKDLHISTVDGRTYVNSARVESTNLLVNNGVIHVISDVLNPNNDTAKPVPDADPPPPAFENANSVSTDPLTDGIPSPTSVIPLPGVTNGGEGGGGGGGGESTTPSSPTATVTETQSGGGGGGGGGAGGGPEPTATTTPQPGAAATERAKAGLAAAVGLGVVLINA